VPQRSTILYRTGKVSSTRLRSYGLIKEQEKLRCCECNKLGLPASSQGLQGQEESSASRALPGHKQLPCRHHSHQQPEEVSPRWLWRTLESPELRGRGPCIRLALPRGAAVHSIAVACTRLVFLCGKADKNPWIAPTLALAVPKALQGSLVRQNEAVWPPPQDITLSGLLASFGSFPSLPHFFFLPLVFYRIKVLLCEIGQLL